MSFSEGSFYAPEASYKKYELNVLKIRTLARSSSLKILARVHCTYTYLYLEKFQDSNLNCPKNNLNLDIKTDPVTVGADATSGFLTRQLHTKARHTVHWHSIPLQLRMFLS